LGFLWFLQLADCIEICRNNFHCRNNNVFETCCRRGGQWCVQYCLFRVCRHWNWNWTRILRFFVLYLDCISEKCTKFESYWQASWNQVLLLILKLYAGMRWFVTGVVIHFVIRCMFLYIVKLLEYCCYFEYIILSWSEKSNMKITSFSFEIN